MREQSPQITSGRYLPIYICLQVTVVGDDIAWLRPDEEGRLRAINPENGFFGVAPGTSWASNPVAMQTIFKDTIFRQDRGMDGWMCMQVPIACPARCCGSGSKRISFLSFRIWIRMSVTKLFAVSEPGLIILDSNPDPGFESGFY